VQAQHVFSIQATHRFLHAFLIHGSAMELWVFDQCELYSSRSFDVHNNPHRPVKILTGYAMMNHDKLSLNTSTQADEDGK
jgi:hypothetical protein